MALRETYAYHRATAQMFSHVLADARDHPVMVPYHLHWRRAADVLLEPWPTRGRRRVRARAAIALALSFDTWRTLSEENGLSDREAAETGVRLVLSTLAS